MRQHRWASDVWNNGIVFLLQCLQGQWWQKESHAEAEAEQDGVAMPQHAGKVIEHLHHSDTHVCACMHRQRKILMENKSEGNCIQESVREI